MILRLSEPVGEHRLCGPSAVAMLSARSTDDAARLLTEVTGRAEIVGVNAREMTMALERVWLRLVPLTVPRGTRPTVMAFADRLDGRTGLLLVDMLDATEIIPHWCLCQSQQGIITLGDNHRGLHDVARSHLHDAPVSRGWQVLTSAAYDAREEASRRRRLGAQERCLREFYDARAARIAEWQAHDDLT